MQTGQHEPRLICTLIASFLVVASAWAEEVQHLSITVPGGMPGLPILTGMERATNGAKITWDGPPGYYQLYRQTNLTGSNWQKFGSPNLNRNTNFATLPGNAFFRVLGPSPEYVGSQACLECHDPLLTHPNQLKTRHAGAFTNALFVAQGGQTNRTCLPCHTVGYGLPTGFVSKTDPNTNPRLAGVQCESCHGPAAEHAANPMNLATRPRVDIAGQVCGGCHDRSYNPTFDEWKSSGHFAVVEDMNPPDRIIRCGQCHSGTARLALIKGISTTTISTTLTNDANVGITCVVCHDLDANHVWTNVVTGLVYTNQLRQTLTSTNDFFLTTSDNFTNKYNPNINLCAQCHNHRGASWTTTSRPPHNSPQYNMLLGTLPSVPGGVTGGPAAHAGVKFLTNNIGGLLLVTNQCVTCHMQTQAHQYSPPESAAVPGHSFTVTAYGACVDCHGSGAMAKPLALGVKFSPMKCNR